MKRLLLLLLALAALTACERKPAAAPAAASPTPAPAQSPAPAAPGAAPQVEAPAQVNLDPQAIENQRVKEEVLKRVDLMPGLTPEEKDKIYVQVERAQAMGKVITIPFPSGRIALDDSAIAAIGEKLALDQVRQFTEDPTVIFVVLGFADKKGDPQQNQEISLARAEAVLKTLQTRFRLQNIMHAVGMGSSEMFDAQDLDKNRVVELWAVLP
jgi:outer membrane protein OmpA-like peptidoglycan-associated protein